MPSCTAEGNVEVVLSFVDESWYQGIDHLVTLVYEVFRNVELHYVAADLPVISCKSPEAVYIEGIGNEPHVESNIGFRRKAVFISETGDVYVELAAAFVSKENPVHLKVELGHFLLGGIYYVICLPADWLKFMAFFFDDFPGSLPS